MLLTAWKLQKETDTEKTVDYYFQWFHGSSTEPESIQHSLEPTY